MWKIPILLIGKGQGTQGRRKSHGAIFIDCGMCLAGGAITLRAALARYADLLSPVSKPALQALSAFANGEDAARLHRLLSPEGAAEYKAWHQQSRCLLEVLEEFPNIKPPLGELPLCPVHFIILRGV